MTTRATTDRGVGLGLVFSLVAVAAACATAVFGYQSAIGHGVAGADTQVLSGVAFGVAVVGGSLAVVAIHVFAR